jgi:hypothetical protein
MFEKDEVLKELHGRLVAAGINPLDPKVQAISEVVNAFYAGGHQSATTLATSRKASRSI